MEVTHLNYSSTVAETTEITKEVSLKILAAAIADQYLTDENSKLTQLSELMLQGIGTPRGKALSDLYKAADDLRDNLLFAFITIVKGFEAWEHEPTQSAAKLLGKISRSHGTEIAQKTLETESALLTSLLNDCSQPQAVAAIATLGLSELVAQLKAAQQSFANLTAESATIEAQKDGKAVPSNIRRQTINALNAIIDYLNLMLRNESRKAIYSTLASEIAVLVDALNLKIERRQTPKEAKPQAT